MNEKHLGSKTMFVYADQPTSGATYCKLTFTYYTTIGDIHGASHQESHKMVVEVYIKSGLFATNIWDATNYMWESVSDNSLFSVDTAWGTATTGVFDVWYGSASGYSWPS